MRDRPLLGHPRLHLRVIDSTNDRARALALAGAPHGTLVTASEQTAGRGRQGRRWLAPPGSALLMSIVLRAAEDEQDGSPHRRGPYPHPPLPLIAAVAVCDVVGDRAMVKWPNDIVLPRTPRTATGRRGNDASASEREPARLAKLAGILVEGRPQAGWAVLGIGLNVAVSLEELPAELSESAATLGETSAAIEPILSRLLGALERRLAEPGGRVLRAYRARDALRGRDVAWSGGGGRAEGVDERGRLLVALERDGTIALDSGEVHLRL